MSDDVRTDDQETSQSDTCPSAHPRTPASAARLGREWLPAFEWKPAVVLLVSTAALAVVYYHPNVLRLDERYRLFSWHLLNFVLLFVLPALVVRFVFRERLSDYGFQLGEWRVWGKWLLLFVAVFIPIALIASRLPAFANFYPRYRPIVSYHRPLLGGYTMLPPDHRLILLSISGWLVYFFAWEFFFRGFMLFGLGRYIGALAIFVQMVPFAMAHFPKLEPEAWASVFAAVALGVMAWRSKSFVGPWLVHWLAATTMDLFVVFWPLHPH